MGKREEGKRQGERERRYRASQDEGGRRKGEPGREERSQTA